jgi:putative membrane protein
MMYPGGYMWGTYWLWWILWIAVTVFVVVAAVRVASRSSHSGRPTPLEMLQQRYAAGEISTAEYEERRAKLKERV